ncbi:hypothetical protein [Poseidonibacter ostreae]|uniref:Uncharacterized protein n=1 Tax=Poseidonibacter ostreae TaxID=2654171 RepID=A0A6L4WSU5_9BACT|nr:hypothetical protein [Poseidonibacter ostreae]KAB7884986.1 hypothetical protein GA417_09675 [Poseidonibacter ostreae]KAB7888978.1 hypothetical protein GBG19_07255 [Poseidonibacter ostreae]KAB7891911.1 hypothetical protein GBG18_04805 [Poseidonibacter ostreae]MAC84350.1 hypothetical protein [Arcobacter sp.]
MTTEIEYGYTTILGHEIKINGFTNELEDTFITSINDGILAGEDSGSLVINGETYDWEIINDQLPTYEDIDFNKILQMDKESRISISVSELIKLAAVNKSAGIENITSSYTIRKVPQDTYLDLIDTLQKSDNWIAETDNDDNYTQVDVEDKTLGIIKDYGLLTNEQINTIINQKVTSIILVS